MQLQKWYHDGYYKTFYDSGQLETVSTMKEGSKNGQFKNYDREGHLVLEGNFMNGRLHGDNTGYYADGTIKHRFKYEEGTKAGTALSYHPNGKLKIKEQASMTGQDWVIEEYTDTDKLMSVKRFKNKQPEGTWIYYFPDGKTDHVKESYENGKLSVSATNILKPES
jgi:antitoxin component YwqK of YwqJK toxin-antitoxin module